MQIHLSGALSTIDFSMSASTTEDIPAEDIETILTGIMAMVRTGEMTKRVDS